MNNISNDSTCKPLLIIDIGFSLYTIHEATIQIIDYKPFLTLSGLYLAIRLTASVQVSASFIELDASWSTTTSCNQPTLEPKDLYRIACYNWITGIFVGIYSRQFIE